MRGFTLIELVVTLTITALLLMAGVTLLGSATGASETIGKGLDSTRNSIDLLAALRNDLNQCRIETISTDSATVTYSLPMHAGDDGAAVDRYGEVIWEVTDDKSVVTKRLITLGFEVDRLLKESALGKDINRDGDMTDVFDIGYLTKTSNIEGRRAMPRLYIALLNGDHTGDVDGDGLDDPLFSVEAGTTEIQVSMWRLIDDDVLKLVTSHCLLVESAL